MYKLCKSEQSANRQRELEQGLLQAMCSCHYDEISVSELCDRMGIPRKSFYRYFSGKDGALHALIDHTLMQYEMKNLGRYIDPGASATKELENYFKFWREQKPLLDALGRSGLSGVLIERAIDYSLSEGDIRRPISFQTGMGEQEYTIIFAICGLMTMMVHWHHDGYVTSVQRMAAIAARVLTKPLFRDQ